MQSNFWTSVQLCQCLIRLRYWRHVCSFDSKILASICLLCSLDKDLDISIGAENENGPKEKNSVIHGKLFLHFFLEKRFGCCLQKKMTRKNKWVPVFFLFFAFNYWLCPLNSPTPTAKASFVLFFVFLRYFYQFPSLHETIIRPPQNSSFLKCIYFFLISYHQSNPCFLKILDELSPFYSWNFVSSGIASSC